MAFLTDNSSSWTDNSVYEIQATDPVEGASALASFGGIGVSNEPHQILANRTAFLKRRQDLNITAIGNLQAFVSEFVGSRTNPGYIEIPYQDVSAGAGSFYVQWGFISFLGLSSGSVTNGTFQQNFAIAFPNLCLKVMTSLQSNWDFDTVGALDEAALSIEPIAPYSRTVATFYVDYNGAGTVRIASSFPVKLGLTGIEWFAIGF
jgi:hypothetical protein